MHARTCAHTRTHARTHACMHTHTHTHTPQVHSLKSLHEATQLPYQDLCDALLALTADRQCVLLTNQPSPHEPPSPTPTPEEDNYLQTTPFKINTTFLVNQDFSADIARKQKSNKVRFHDVRLVNRNQVNVSSREERTVDLAHVFERRRAIIDSAIVRILKQEKEMSVDNIAFMVGGSVCMGGGVGVGVCVWGGWECMCVSSK